MHPRLLRASRVGAAALLSGFAHAQVLIVDASNGPGTSFTSLTAAVAAAPDGAVLRVRAGRYSAFTLQAKGLAVVGEEGQEVRIGTLPGDRSIEVIGTAAHQPVLLKNLVFADTHLEGGRALFQNVAGSVTCVDLRLDATATGFPSSLRFYIERAANVQFEGCDFGSPLGYGSEPRIHARLSQIGLHRTLLTGSRGPSVTYGQPPSGSLALELLRARCWNSSSTLRGGTGALGCSGFFGCTSTSGAGGAGVRAFGQSTFLALRTTVDGAPGHPAFSSSGGIVAASDGGPGLVLETGSTAIFEGSAPRGGASQASPGASSRVDASSTLHVDAPSRPSVASMSGQQTLGSSLSLTLLAPANTVGILQLAPNADLAPIDLLSPGSVLRSASPVTSAFAVGASNSFLVVLPVPASYPLGQTAYAQFLTWHPASGEAWATHPSSIHVNH